MIQALSDGAFFEKESNLALYHETGFMSKANNPSLRSWVEVPEHSDFPIQNLPFGIFKTRYLSPVAGVAIGSQVLDLVYLHEHGFLDGLGLPVGIFNQRYLNDFLSLGKKKGREVRERISELLQLDNTELQGKTWSTTNPLPMKASSR